MASSNTVNKYDEAVKAPANQTIKVLQNDVQIAYWPPDTQVQNLVTGCLNACTAIAIISPKAAILAHIGPLSNGTTGIEPGTDPGPEHVTSLLTQMETLFLRNREKFDPSETWVVAGIWQNGPSMADGIHLANQMLRQYNLQPKWKSYQVLKRGQPRMSGQTTVVIEAYQRGAMPRVYLNNDQIN